MCLVWVLSVTLRFGCFNLYGCIVWLVLLVLVCISLGCLLLLGSCLFD